MVILTQEMICYECEHLMCWSAVRFSDGTICYLSRHEVDSRNENEILFRNVFDTLCNECFLQRVLVRSFWVDPEVNHAADDLHIVSVECVNQELFFQRIRSLRGDDRMLLIGDGRARNDSSSHSRSRSRSRSHERSHSTTSSRRSRRRSRRSLRPQSRRM